MINNPQKSTAALIFNEKREVRLPFFRFPFDILRPVRQRARQAACRQVWTGCSSNAQVWLRRISDKLQIKCLTISLPHRSVQKSAGL